MIDRSVISLLFFLIFLPGISLAADSDSFSAPASVSIVETGSSDPEMVSGIKKLTVRIKDFGKNLAGTTELLKKAIPGAGVLRWIKEQAFKIVFLIVSLVIIFITINFYMQKAEKSRFLTTTRLSVMDKEVQRACRNIESHFAMPDYSVKKLCEELVTGEAFLEALFQKELGMTIEEFIAQVRINHARILLNKDPGVPAVELASLCGFRDTQMFYDAFLHITGTGFPEYAASQSAGEAL